MKNSILFLKYMLFKRFGLMLVIWMSIFQLMYFKNALIIHGVGATFIDVNIYILNNIRAIIFYISPTFVVLLYFIFNHYGFKILEMSRVQNKWKWFLNDFKKVVLIVLVFLTLMCTIVLIFSIGKVSFDSRITLSSVNTAIGISINKMNAYSILVFNYILMGSYLLSLGVIFISLGLVLKSKEVIIVSIMLFLGMNKALFYNAISHVGNLTFLNSAILMEEFKDSDIKSIFLVKFIYFLIIIGLNLAVVYIVCKKSNFKLYKKKRNTRKKSLILKSLNLKNMIVWSFLAIVLCLLFIFNRNDFESIETVFYMLLKEPTRNIFNVSVFITFYGSLTVIIGKIIYRESRESLLFYLVRKKSIKDYLISLFLKGLVAIGIYYIILIVLILVGAKVFEITALGSVNIIISYVIKSILLSIIFMLLEIIGLIILKQEWFGTLIFIVGVLFHNFIQLISPKMIYLSLISYNISSANIKFYISIIVFVIIISILIGSIFRIANSKDNIYFVQ